MEARLESVASKDGTRIAFERTGSGPAVILVDGALCSRAFGPMPKLARHLAQAFTFTVLTYDRRGRGDSGDTRPYAVERELDDLDALVAAAGGAADVLGISSGGALALAAAARGASIRRVAAYEPPYVADGGDGAAAAHEDRLAAMIAAGRRDEAVRYFMRDMVGAPAPIVWLMRLVPGTWRKLRAVAHTLPYDAAVMGDFSVPAPRFAAIRTPTLVLHGERSDPRLRRAARAVATAVPGARHAALAGQSHAVKPEPLAAAVAQFFA